jgi:hypothetical protein
MSGVRVAIAHLPKRVDLSDAVAHAADERPNLTTLRENLLIAQTNAPACVFLVNLAAQCFPSPI